jgi:hypothetical protein
VVSVYATGSKVHGYKPGRGRWGFKGDKNPQRLEEKFFASARD